MRVMILTQVLPYPPDSGPKVKTWNVIKYLSRKHEITLVSFTRGNQASEIAHLQQVCARVETTPITRKLSLDAGALVHSLLNGKPWLIVRDNRREMHRMVKALAIETQTDIIHADQLNMGQYAISSNGIHTLLDAHNALWQLYQRLADTFRTGPKRWLYQREWRLLKSYEGNICRRFDAITVVSEEDRLALSEAMKMDCPATIIPITVDMDDFPTIRRQPNANHILSIGTMFWQPNVEGILWFLREVYPIIREQKPNVEFDIIGARPPKEITDYANTGVGIHVHGYLPDPLPIQQQAGVMVVPLHAGSGMRVKILNAMSQALPIVTTPIGCEGIAVEDRKHLLIAESPAQFAQDVVYLLDHPDEANGLGQTGQQLIRDQYDYRKALDPLDRIYSGLCNPPERIQR